jgi:uncharacterized protein YkwD
MNHKGPHPGLFVVSGVLLLAGLALAAPGKDQRDVSKDEQAVVDELSLARTKPLEYVRFLEAYRRQIRTDKTVVVNGRNIQTQEGAKAVEEAIAYLKKVKPMTALTLSRPLSLAARDHVQDTGPVGITGHAGTDGSTFGDRIARYGKVRTTAGENISYGPEEARAIVMQLIIDDGVASRGHRTNIYTPDFKTVGVAIGSHMKYGVMCVTDFADAVTATKDTGKKAR